MKNDQTQINYSI